MALPTPGKSERAHPQQTKLSPRSCRGENFSNLGQAVERGNTQPTGTGKSQKSIAGPHVQRATTDKGPMEGKKECPTTAGGYANPM